jgi:septum formation topological specificity factor MinE
MIASALRAEIERSANRMRSHNPLFSGAAEATLRARSATPSASLDPLLAALDGRSADRPVHLACRAFFQYLAAENGLPWIRMVEERCGIPRETLDFLGTARQECRDRVEEALDAIDREVDDPTLLPALRDELREVISRFDRLCEEATHAARLGDVHVSAA